MASSKQTCGVKRINRVGPSSKSTNTFTTPAKRLSLDQNTQRLHQPNMSIFGRSSLMALPPKLTSTPNVTPANGTPANELPPKVTTPVDVTPTDVMPKDTMTNDAMVPTDVMPPKENAVTKNSLPFERDDYLFSQSAELSRRISQLLENMKIIDEIRRTADASSDQDKLFYWLRNAMLELNSVQSAIIPRCSSLCDYLVSTTSSPTHDSPRCGQRGSQAPTMC